MSWLGIKLAFMADGWLLARNLRRWALLLLLKFDLSEVEQDVELVELLGRDQIQGSWCRGGSLLARYDVASKCGDLVFTLLAVSCDDVSEWISVELWALATLKLGETLHEHELERLPLELVVGLTGLIILWHADTHHLVHLHSDLQDQVGLRLDVVSFQIWFLGMWLDHFVSWCLKVLAEVVDSDLLLKITMLILFICRPIEIHNRLVQKLDFILSWLFHSFLNRWQLPRTYHLHDLDVKLVRVLRAYLRWSTRLCLSVSLVGKTFEWSKEMIARHFGLFYSRNLLKTKRLSKCNY